MPRWLAGAGAVLAAVMLGIFYPRADESSSLMDEMEQVFPGRVAGVITRDQDVDIVLYDVPLLRPEDQRVAFTISGPDGETTVFTYSGNKISVDSGQTLTPLLSGNGGVVVIGDDGSVIKGWRVRG